MGITASCGEAGIWDVPGCGNSQKCEVPPPHYLNTHSVGGPRNSGVPLGL